MENIMSDRARKTVEHCFRHASVGDRFGFVTLEGTGGMYDVEARESRRGPDGDISLQLKNAETTITLSLRSDGPNIVCAGLVRPSQPRGRKAKAPAAVEPAAVAPAPEAAPAEALAASA